MADSRRQKPLPGHGRNNPDRPEASGDSWELQEHEGRPGTTADAYGRIENLSSADRRRFANLEREERGRPAASGGAEPVPREKRRPKRLR